MPEYTFTLTLQHQGKAFLSLNNYTLELNLQEEGGKGTTVKYTDANNREQKLTSTKEVLSHFTNQKELSPENPNLYILVLFVR